jgi:ferredoxin
MKINPDKCVACGNCTYVCPMGAIYIDPVIKRATIDRDECVECYACYNGLSTEHLNPPLVRMVRKMLQWGRVRFGRPGVGVWLRDIQKMTWALAKAGVAFEKRNPFTLLMTDVTTGTIREDVLGEKVMSAIVEIKVGVERTEEIIALVHEVEKEVDTVVSLGVGTRCDEAGEETVVAPILERLGYKLERAKTNVGLGRITNSTVK